MAAVSRLHELETVADDPNQAWYDKRTLHSIIIVQKIFDLSGNEMLVRIWNLT
jgi:hypothetical protein